MEMVGTLALHTLAVDKLDGGDDVVKHKDALLAAVHDDGVCEILGWNYVLPAQVVMPEDLFIIFTPVPRMDRSISGNTLFNY